MCCVQIAPHNGVSLQSDLKGGMVGDRAGGGDQGLIPKGRGKGSYEGA